jgi:hypothetical protein
MHAIVRNLQSLLARTIHDWLVRSSRPAGLFSFGLLDGLNVRLRRPYLREAPAGFGPERLATAVMNNPACQFASHFHIDSHLQDAEKVALKNRKR